MGVDVLSSMPDTARFRLNAGSGATVGRPETRCGGTGCGGHDATPWRSSDADRRRSWCSLIR